MVQWQEFNLVLPFDDLLNIFFRWTAADGKIYQTQVAFQVFIAPDAYGVGPETVAAEGQIDPKFSNDEIEWFTNHQGSTILYGLLIKLVSVD